MRHGRTAWNRAGRIQGRIDEPLDAEARDHLAGLRLPDGFEQAALFSSPLSRAAETALIVCRRTPVIAPALIEMDWGEWEGRRGVDLLASANSGYRHIEDWGWDFQPPGGETPRMVWERVKPWIASVEGPTVAVSHIGVMRVLLARATGWNFEGPAPFQVKRGRLYRIHIHDHSTLAFDNQPIRLIENSMKRVSILVTHLLGTGHLSRALTLARAARDAELRPQLISGGMPAGHLDTDPPRPVRAGG